MVDNNEQKTPEKIPEKFGTRMRRAFFWVVQYWRELFNFKFDKYMIIQVLPGVYGIALVAIACGLIYVCVEAFMASTWRGLFYFFFAAPLTFLVLASVLRALLEFYMVVFKMSEHVDELVGLRDTVDRLSGISDSVDEMVAVTRRIPFWRALSVSSGKTSKPRSRKADREQEKQSA
ncbi:DUF4282 domain-containing protein [Alcanivorax jadensis]|uniref:DUF4282 domain-containing protein n=1 Tax=Alcanivorax jadensis TaxID=64988 RepID=UPI003566CA0B